MTACLIIEGMGSTSASGNEHEAVEDLCPVCAALATPHCSGGHCVWLTCTSSECATTWHPLRPEILLRPPAR